jgi:hypothetical protein
MNDGIRRALEMPLPDRIRMCAVEYVASTAFASRREFYKQHRAPVSGNLVAGRGEDLLWLADAFLAEWRHCLAEDICVNQEMALGYILHHHLERFDVYYGRWATALANYGAVKHDHDYILSTITRSRGADDHAESRRRLDAIRPYLDGSNSARWLTFWDEWYLANWYLGRVEHCREALAQLIDGASNDPAKRMAVENKGDRLIQNAGFLQQPARVAVLLRDQPSTLADVREMLRQHDLQGRVDVVVPGEFHPLMLSPGAIRYVARSRFVRESYAAVFEPEPVREPPHRTP